MKHATENREPRTNLGTRRKSRELTLQMLFQSEMGKQSPDDVRQSFWAQRADVACTRSRASVKSRRSHELTAACAAAAAG